MSWDFPVPLGTPIEVRLYMANSCTCTNDPGERTFDVRLDGNLVLDNYDEVADVGWRVGTMKAFDITSDGNVDIDFGHRTEMPLINAIEIVRTDIAPVAVQSALTKNSFTGAAPVGPPATIPTDGVDWAQARGAFWANGNIYTGWSNGHFYARSFDGTTLGDPRDINLNGLLTGTPTFFSPASITGMFLDGGRMYYTQTGDSNLYYRYFSAESEIVGAQRFQASTNGGVDWSQVAWADGRRRQDLLHPHGREPLRHRLHERSPRDRDREPDQRPGDRRDQLAVERALRADAERVGPKQRRGRSYGADPSGSAPRRVNALFSSVSRSVPRNRQSAPAWSRHPRPPAATITGIELPKSARPPNAAPPTKTVELASGIRNCSPNAWILKM